MSIKAINGRIVGYAASALIATGIAAQQASAALKAHAAHSSQRSALIGAKRDMGVSKCEGNSFIFEMGNTLQCGPVNVRLIGIQSDGSQGSKGLSAVFDVQQQMSPTTVTNRDVAIQQGMSASLLSASRPPYITIDSIRSTRGSYDVTVSVSRDAGQDISNNWSGYVAQYPNATHPRSAISGVSASITVPYVSTSYTGVSKTTDAEASQWIGIGGFHSNDLIQAGVSANYFAGIGGAYGPVRYYAWYQLLGQNASMQRISMNVNPGDDVMVNIFLTNPGFKPQIWRISIDNETSGQTFLINLPYKSSMGTADYIIERPTIAFGGNPQSAYLPDFGAAQFSGARISTYDPKSGIIGSVSLGMFGGSIERVSMQAGPMDGSVNAVPSKISPEGSFHVLYRNGQQNSK